MAPILQVLFLATSDPSPRPPSLFHFSVPSLLHKNLISPPIYLVHQGEKEKKMSLEARLQAASAEYQKLQIDYSNAVEARQKLDAQLSENELVKKVRLILYFFLLTSIS